MFVIKWMGSSVNVVKYVDFDSGYRQINFNPETRTSSLSYFYRISFLKEFYKDNAAKVCYLPEVDALDQHSRRQLKTPKA
jgi:hypothetical protein